MTLFVDDTIEGKSFRLIPINNIFEKMPQGNSKKKFSSAKKKANAQKKPLKKGGMWGYWVLTVLLRWLINWIDCLPCLLWLQEELSSQRKDLNLHQL